MVNKELKEQIEEMWNDIGEKQEGGWTFVYNNSEYTTDVFNKELAEHLVVNKGYRKQKEVIDEFVERLLDKYDIWTDNDVLEYNYVSKLARRVAEEMKGGAE